MVLKRLQSSMQQHHELCVFGQKELSLLERGIESLKTALSHLLKPRGEGVKVDEELVSAWARADQKKDQRRSLERDYEEADAKARELEEKAREARFVPLSLLLAAKI